MPTDSFLVGYTNHIAVAVIAQNSEDPQSSLNQVTRRVSSWVEEHSVDLATGKHEIQLLTQ